MAFQRGFWTLVCLFVCLLVVTECAPQSPFESTSLRDHDGGGKLAQSSPWKVFISYRRAVSRHLAMLLKVLFLREQISSFIDVEDLGAGHWDEQILEAIETTPNFVIVLSNGTLDRAIGDTNYTDFLHQEIRAAVASGRNIIPIFDEYTHPDAEFSPEIQEMMTFQGITWNLSLVNATLDVLISYLVDDPINSTAKISSETLVIGGK